MSLTATPMVMGEPVAADAPVELDAEPAAELVAEVLFGAAVVGLDVDLEDDPHAASKATASKALPPIAVTFRPRMVMPPKRGLGVASVRSPALFSRSLMVKFFLSPGWSSRHVPRAA
jgi:hypothetical protein